MGHKTPWKSSASMFAFAKPKTRFIVDKDDELIAEVYARIEEEAEAKRDLIVTAVNVMPEVKVFLERLQAGDFESEIVIMVADMLLKKLEAVDGN